MSSSDSDSDLEGLPHFETIVTTALVEPERSSIASVNYQKSYVQTNKNNTNSKSYIILKDLDAIEVLSNHNNNEFDSVTKDFDSISYGTFNYQLQKLPTLTSTRVEPQKKKIEFKKQSKPLKRKPTSTRNQYNIKRVNYRESSEDDDAFARLVKAIQKDTKPKSIKRGGSTVNKSHISKKSKTDVLPKVKQKQLFVVQDMIGYAKNDDSETDFSTLLKANLSEIHPKPNNGYETLSRKICAPLTPDVLEDETISIKPKSVKSKGPIANKKNIFKKSKSSQIPLHQSFHKNGLLEIQAKNYYYQDDSYSLSSLSNPLELDTKTGDGLDTLASKSCAPIEPVLKDDKIILMKSQQSCIAENLLRSKSNLEENSLELNSDLESNDDCECSLNVDKICLTLKSNLEDVVILLDCNPKTDEKIQPVNSLVGANENNVDKFTEANSNNYMVLSQDKCLNQVDSERKFKKSYMEICEWIATGIQENQEDEIFKQTEGRLREISKYIQNSLNIVNGPITLKNYKCYNFLLDLEDKLNTYFSEDYDIDVRDYDNVM